MAKRRERAERLLPAWRVGDRLFDSARVLLMGVLNVTPDSFSDGGRFFDIERAVACARDMAAQGADLIDIGGESTRPDATPVSADVERARVVPIITRLRGETNALLSVDTMKADVAAAALAAGAEVVNDVSGLADPRMADVVARAGASLVVMHMQGTPQTMQCDPRYQDVVADVSAALCALVDRAVAAGVARDRIVVDPGIGFGKRLEHNLALMAHLDVIAQLTGRPVLVGPSRKSFLGALTGRSVDDRLLATAGAVAAGVLAGASLVRVHDVPQMRDVIQVATAVRDARRRGARG